MPSQNDNNAPALWEYVSPGDYKVPTDSVEQTVQNRLAELWDIIRPQKAEPENSPYKAEDELESVSSDFLGWAAPAPDWQPAVSALDSALTGIDPEKYGRSAIFVIGQPHDGRTEIVTRWAEQQEWRIIQPPTPHEILTENDSWLNQLREDERPWLLPRLEKCYLRHARGLTGLRMLFNELGTGRLGRGVVGCDSWAWAYLRQVVQGSPPVTLMSQAFDHDRLQRWLRALAPDHLAFRQADDGQYVLPAVSNDEEGESQEVSHSMLRHLAARSRGIPLVAWHLWRTGLRAETDAELEAAIEDDPDSAPETTVWVLPWSQFKKLSLPSSADQETAFILHALLLHDGLPADLLPQLLPLSRTAVMQQLAVLQAGGIVETSDELWRVTPLGYPFVRQFLSDKGYLTDAE